MMEHAYPGYQKTSNYLEEARHRGEMFTSEYCQVLLETLDGYAHEAQIYRALLKEYIALADAWPEDVMAWHYEGRDLQQRTKALLGQE